MPTISLNSFAGGEWSPALRGRTELEKYVSSSRTMQNFIVQPHGSASNRSGLEYIAETKTSAKESRLIPFQFSVEQAYILEFGDLYIRFYKDGGVIVDGASPYEITTPYLEADLFDIKYAQDADTMILCHPDYPTMKLTRTGHTAWFLSRYFPLSIAGVLYSAGSWHVTNVAANAFDGSTTTVASAGATGAMVGQDYGLGGDKDIRQVRIFPKLAVGKGIWSLKHSDDDITWTVANLDGSATITLTGADAWSEYEVAAGAGSHRYWALEAITFAGSPSGAQFSEAEFSESADGWAMPMLPGNSTAITMTPSAASGTITLTSSSAYFESTMEGTQFALHGGYVAVHEYVSSTVMNGLVIGSDLSATTATATWSEGAFSEKRGYPSCVSYYGQRLFLAGTTHQPQTVWGSEIGDYDFFEVGSEDDDAMSFTIADNQVNAIKWIVPDKVLNIGTTGGVFTLSSGSASSPLTPTNVVVQKQTQYGASDLNAQLMGSFLYYMARNTKIMREMAYNYDFDSHMATDITIMSKHITGDGIVDLAYQQTPYSTLWCVRDDGEIATLVRIVDQKILGWARQVTDGYFESVAVIPGTTEDEVWTIVKRYIDGANVRYVERLLPRLPDEDIEEAFFVDSGLSYDGAPATTISGADHLEGEAVSVLADGLVVTGHTVSGGDITLATAASKVKIGLAYSSILETQDIEYITETGSVQAKRRQVDEVVVRLDNSSYMRLGPDSSNADVVPFTVGELFTGDKEIPMTPGDPKTGRVYIINDQPLPLDILSIMAEMSDEETIQ